MESEWIEYDSAGYPHKRPAPLGNCDSQQSEQPQGEATPDTNCGRCFGSGQYTRDGFGGKDFKSCECVTSAQTEGGEKPKSPCCHLTMRDDTAFYTCSCGRHWIPVELSLPTKWREIESASPPAQPAGGAREWLKEHSAVFTGMDDIEYVAGHMERYAAQVSKSEREARERAEKVLREYGQHHVNCNQAELESGCTCGFTTALASLKSSGGAKMYILQNEKRNSVKVILQGRGPKGSNDTRSLVIVDATVDQVVELIREAVKSSEGAK